MSKEVLDLENEIVRSTFAYGSAFYALNAYYRKGRGRPRSPDPVADRLNLAADRAYERRNGLLTVYRERTKGPRRETTNDYV
jgi:hypothetical protein